MKPVVLLLCAAYAALNVAGAALIKAELGAGHTLNSAREYVTFLTAPKVFGGLAIIGLAALVLFKALAMDKFTVVIPISVGINFVLTALLGYALFGERQSLTSAVAYALIFAGVLLLSRSR